MKKTLPGLLNRFAIFLIAMIFTIGFSACGGGTSSPGIVTDSGDVQGDTGTDINVTDEQNNEDVMIITDIAEKEDIAVDIAEKEDIAVDIAEKEDIAVDIAEKEDIAGETGEDVPLDIETDTAGDMSEGISYDIEDADLSETEGIANDVAEGVSQDIEDTDVVDTNDVSGEISDAGDVADGIISSEDTIEEDCTNCNQSTAMAAWTLNTAGGFMALPDTDMNFSVSGYGERVENQDGLVLFSGIVW